MIVFYVILVIVLLLILGQHYPQIALTIAAIILLSAMIYNTDKLKSLMKGEFPA